MRYGPYAPKGLPKQDQEKLMLLADRWARALVGHDKWAQVAKKCTDFVESRQWDERSKQLLLRQKRPALVFNEINPLVRLVLGYFLQNRTDIRFNPGHDGTGSEAVAEAATRIAKQIAEANELSEVDGEMFLDGMITGRGIQDCRLDFEHNDFGEVRWRSDDPFRVKIDPELESYDLDEAGYLVEDRMVCIDEVEWLYGEKVAGLVLPFARGNTPTGFIMSAAAGDPDTHPIRGMGQEEEFDKWWTQYASLLGDFADPYRKSLRILDFQCWVRDRKRVFVDLETGDRSIIPDDWDRAKIEKCLYHAEQLGNPLAVEKRAVKRVQWTTVIGDLIVHDKPSPYGGFSKIGFFPWWRRGITRGMVEDLIDPQTEVNKRRSLEIEIVGRTTHSGWQFHESSLDPKEEANLKRHGSKPGFNLKWKGDKEPKKIDSSPPPTAMERLEQKGVENIRRTAGINESALGELDRVQSGRAVEARQRQAVIGINPYTSNFKRTKRLQGRKTLELIQNHYTEPRIFRILGEDGNFTTFWINKSFENPAKGISQLFDVTLGKYVVSIDETPLSDSFLNAQFEEALTLVEKLQLPPIAIMDVLIDLSTLPRKDDIKQRLQAIMGPPPGATPPGGPGPGTALPPPVATPPGAGSLDEAAAPGGKVVRIPTTGAPARVTA